MANYAVSDPADGAVWQANHDAWAKLVNEEMQHRVGRTAPAYRELLQLVGGREQPSLATTGSSSSTLSDMQAFERGYRGGFR
jgi:hypothetical protein